MAIQHMEPARSVSTIGLKLPLHLRPMPTFDPRGEPDLKKRLEKGGFHQVLGNILRTANFQGTFKYHVQVPKKGTTHSKGLTFKQAVQFGVILTYHEGSNDNNIQVLLYAPHHMDPGQFLKRLLEAQGDILMKTKPPAQAERRSESAGDGVPPLPTGEPEEKKHVASTGEPKEKKHAPMGVAEGYTHKLDQTSVGELMSELAKHAAQDGYVLKVHCTDLLIDVFNFRADRLGPVYRSLFANGDLLHVEKDGTLVRLGVRWRKELLAREVNGDVSVEVAEAPQQVPEAEYVTQKPSLGDEQAQSVIEERFVSLSALEPVQPGTNPDPKAEEKLLLKAQVVDLGLQIRNAGKRKAQLERLARRREQIRTIADILAEWDDDMRRAETSTQARLAGVDESALEARYQELKERLDKLPE